MDPEETDSEVAYSPAELHRAGTTTLAPANEIILEINDFNVFVLHGCWQRACRLRFCDCSWTLILSLSCRPALNWRIMNRYQRHAMDGWMLHQV